MTNKQKNYIKKTVVRLINCLVSATLAVVIFLQTMPTNFTLFCLEVDRIEINRQAGLYGWQNWMTESWEENLALVQDLVESSAYAEFLVNANAFVEMFVFMLELFIIGFLVCFSVQRGKSFIRRAKTIIKYHTKKAKNSRSSRRCSAEA